MEEASGEQIKCFGSLSLPLPLLRDLNSVAWREAQASRFKFLLVFWCIAHIPQHLGTTALQNTLLCPADRRENWSQRRDYQHRLKVSSAGEGRWESLVWTFSLCLLLPQLQLCQISGESCLPPFIERELKLMGRGSDWLGVSPNSVTYQQWDPGAFENNQQTIFEIYILRWIFNKALRILKEQGELGHLKMHAGDYK